MKSRTALITILILALVVVYYLIGSDYIGGRNQKEVLAGQVADATGELALIPLPPADLDEQLANAQDSLWEMQESFAIDTNNTRIVNSILRLAEENGVKAIPLATQDWTSSKVLEQNYSVFRIEIAITGNYTQMVNFLYQLENGEPRTLVLENVTVEKVSGGCLLEDTIEGPIEANIRIAIYAPSTTS
jgi:Tfp pilus assembly protein PilO